jgi:hypothetical protein
MENINNCIRGSSYLYKDLKEMDEIYFKATRGMSVEIEGYATVLEIDGDLITLILNNNVKVIFKDTDFITIDLLN